MFPARRSSASRLHNCPPPELGEPFGGFSQSAAVGAHVLEEIPFREAFRHFWASNHALSMAYAHCWKPELPTPGGPRAVYARLVALEEIASCGIAELVIVHAVDGRGEAKCLDSPPTCCISHNLMHLLGAWVACGRRGRRCRQNRPI